MDDLTPPEHPDPARPEGPTGDHTPAPPPVTEPTPAASTPAAGAEAPPGMPPSAPSPPPASPSAPADGRVPRGHVLLPIWLVAVVAGLVLVGVGFGIGWAVAPGGSSTTSSPAGAGASGLFGGGLFGRQPGSGGAFLGVATSAPPSGQGAAVQQVVDGGPAAAAGLRVGDTITAVDGASTRGPGQLAVQIGRHRPGDEVTITYTRSGRRATAHVTLGTRPASSELTPPPTSAPPGSPPS